MGCSFFHIVEPTSHILFIGDTDHSRDEIGDMVASEDFMREAVARGYTRTLIESSVKRPVPKRFAHGPSLGMEIIPVDPRSDENSHEIYATLSAALDEISNVEKFTPEAVKLLLNKVRANSDRAFEDEDKLLARILEEARKGPIIVFYGSSHFCKGTLLEQSIPKENRTIVNCRAHKQLWIISSKDADDIKYYEVPASPAASPSFAEAAGKKSSTPVVAAPNVPVKPTAGKVTIDWSSL